MTTKWMNKASRTPHVPEYFRCMKGNKKQGGNHLLTVFFLDPPITVIRRNAIMIAAIE